MEKVNTSDMQTIVGLLILNLAAALGYIFFGPLVSLLILLALFNGSSIYALRKGYS